MTERKTVSVLEFRVKPENFFLETLDGLGGNAKLPPSSLMQLFDETIFDKLAVRGSSSLVVQARPSAKNGFARVSGSRVEPTGSSLRSLTSGFAPKDTKARTGHCQGAG